MINLVFKKKDTGLILSENEENKNSIKKIHPELMDRIFETFEKSLDNWEEFHDLLHDLHKYVNNNAEKLAKNFRDEYYDYLNGKVSKEKLEYYKSIMEKWIKNIFNSQLSISNIYGKMIDNFKSKKKNKNKTK